MSTIGAEILRIALHDITENQTKLSLAIKSKALNSELRKLLEEQQSLIKSTEELFNQFY